MFLPFSRRIVDSLPEDPFEAILAIIADFRRMMAVVDQTLAAKELRDRQRYEITREACALLSAYLKHEGFAIIVPRLPPEGGKLGEGGEREREREREREEAVTQVIRFMNRLESDIAGQKRLAQSENLEQVYSAALGPALQIEFSEQDLRRLWVLLAALRDLVSISPELAFAHRRRLLKRIDRLVGEFRRETHDLSLFWGFVAEMSLLFRSRNEDASLLASKMKGLIQIVWSAEAKMFGLRPDIPLRFLGQDT